MAATFADRFGGETGPLLGAFMSRAATKLNNKLNQNVLSLLQHLWLFQVVVVCKMVKTLRY